MTTIDLEGIYVVTNHDDLRSCIDGRKGDLIVVIDRREAPRDKRSTDRKDYRAKNSMEDNYSRAGHNWNHSIRKLICCNTRRIAGKKVGWFESTLAHTRNRTLAEGHDPGSYEGRDNTKGAYA